MSSRSDEVVFFHALLTVLSPIVGAGLMLSLSPAGCAVGLLMFLFGMRAWWRAFSGNDPFWGERN